MQRRRRTGGGPTCRSPPCPGDRSAHRRCRPRHDRADDSRLRAAHAVAAAEAAADDASGTAGSTLVTVTHLDGKQHGPRAFGLGQCWFTAPLPEVTLRGRLRDGWTTDDLAYAGGGSPITETIGRGGTAAAAVPSQDRSAGTPADMIRPTERMYGVTLRERPEWRIPASAHRGAPSGTSASPA
ncbi:oxamate carbamoyltransferase subunit AllG family protein [Streptomyces sp. NPDC001443]